MKKIPLFIKNGDKYELIPVQLEQFKDGKWGFLYNRVFTGDSTNPYWEFYLRHCYRGTHLFRLEYDKTLEANRVVMNDR